MTESKDSNYDIAVVGAGNAALLAAVSAQESGASKVLVIEKAPYSLRGGNTRFTGGIFRFTYDGKEDIKDLIPDITEEELSSIDIGKYNHDDFYATIMKVTSGLADPELTGLLIGKSASTARWMKDLGIEWELAERFTPIVRGVRIFSPGAVVQAKGKGPNLSPALFRIAERIEGIEILYETKMVRLNMDSHGAMCGLTVKDKEGFRDVSAPAVILASGGFQSNPEMRVRYLGPEWNLVKVRGTRFDTGDGHTAALEIGAQPYGHWAGCHATPIDKNAPPVGDEEIFDRTNRLSYYMGISVNKLSKRFMDEGEDLGGYTYAKTGRIILNQPDGTAIQIFDAKTVDLIEDRYSVISTPSHANTIEELAEKLKIDPDTLVATVREYNEGVQEGEFNPGRLDGKGTKGVIPPKSNWALRIDTPPFVAYPTVGGITFTFGGLRINTKAQVLDNEDSVIPGLYAAGEITGGFFYHNYPVGAGLMRGSVFGRIAGASAVADML